MEQTFRAKEIQCPCLQSSSPIHFNNSHAFEDISGPQKSKHNVDFPSNSLEKELGSFISVSFIHFCNTPAVRTAYTLFLSLHKDMLTGKENKLYEQGHMKN